MDRPPEHLDYRAPESRHTPPVSSLGISLYLGLIVGLTLIIGWFILPRFQQAMVDFEAPIPALTMGYIAVTRWLVRLPGVVVLMAIPIVVPHLITRIIHRTDDPAAVRARTLLAYILITLLAGVVVAITVLSIFLPLINLVDPLNTTETVR